MNSPQITRFLKKSAGIVPLLNVIYEQAWARVNNESYDSGKWHHETYTEAKSPQNKRRFAVKLHREYSYIAKYVIQLISARVNVRKTYNS